MSLDVAFRFCRNTLVFSAQCMDTRSQSTGCHCWWCPGAPLVTLSLHFSPHPSVSTLSSSQAASGCHQQLQDLALCVASRLTATFQLGYKPR